MSWNQNQHDEDVTLTYRELLSNWRWSFSFRTSRKILCADIMLPLADLGGGRRDARPPPLGQIFFIFMQFFGKNWSNSMLAPPPLGLAPPRLGNPGSATGYCNDDNIDRYTSRLKVKILFRHKDSYWWKMDQYPITSFGNFWFTEIDCTHFW